MQIHRNLQVPNDRIKWNSRVSHWIISYWPELASRRNHGEFLGGKNRGDESFHTTFVWRHLMPERLCANCGSVPASRHAKTDSLIVEITPVCADCPCKDDACKDSSWWSFVLLGAYSTNTWTVIPLDWKLQFTIGTHGISECPKRDPVRPESDWAS